MRFRWIFKSCGELVIIHNNTVKVFTNVQMFETRDLIEKYIAQIQARENYLNPKFSEQIEKHHEINKKPTQKNSNRDLGTQKLSNQDRKRKFFHLRLAS